MDEQEQKLVFNQQKLQAQARNQPLPFEQALSSQLYAKDYEKSFLDKPLAKEDVAKIKELMRKPHLTKEELTEVYHHVATNEVKLLNWQENDKYQLTECVITLESLFNLAMQIYDITEDVQKENPGSKAASVWKANRDVAERNIRTLLTLYLYMSRGTLSLEGTGFDKIITNRHEYIYPQANIESPRQGFFNNLLGGRK